MTPDTIKTWLREVVLGGVALGTPAYLVVTRTFDPAVHLPLVVTLFGAWLGVRATDGNGKGP